MVITRTLVLLNAAIMARWYGSGRAFAMGAGINLRIHSEECIELLGSVYVVSCRDRLPAGRELSKPLAHTLPAIVS